MARKKSNDSEKKLLTPTELELMNILWRLGEASVRDVMTAMPPDRNPAYTSVSTIMRILEQKDAVTSRKVGRGHLYTPKIEKTDYEAKSVNHLVDQVFEGAPAALVQRLLETDGLTRDQLADIRNMLDARLKS